MTNPGALRTLAIHGAKNILISLRPDRRLKGFLVILTPCIASTLVSLRSLNGVQLLVLRPLSQTQMVSNTQN